MRDFHDPYSKELWTQTEKEMLSVIELRWQVGGFIMGPDGELMIIRHSIDGLLHDMVKSNHGVASQTGLHIKIDDLRDSIHNLILSKVNGAGDGNYVEFFEFNADGSKPYKFWKN